MNKKKILHVMVLEKFLASFIDFVDENFGRDGHHYVFITSEKYEYGLKPEHNVEFLYTDDDIFMTLLEYMKIAKKVILHGLWRDKVDLLLYSNQELLKKCYWIMWGGDFYFPENQTKVRHEIIQKMGYLITGTIGDYHLVKSLYKANGTHIKCFNYPSNLYKEYPLKQQTGGCMNIQLGNSATQTNNHKEIMQVLTAFKDENIKIYVPLSYGDELYAKEVVQQGNEIFGNKFFPITEFMPQDSYLEFLSNVDIAIFNHERQQAFGNIITLLGMGKKVYIHPRSTLNTLMKEYDLKSFSTEKIELSPMQKSDQVRNINSVQSNFSKNALRQNLSKYLT